MQSITSQLTDVLTRLSFRLRPTDIISFILIFYFGFETIVCFIGIVSDKQKFQLYSLNYSYTYLGYQFICLQPKLN